MVTTKGGDGLGRALTDMAKRLANAKVVQVGFMSDATEPDGASTAQVAFWNEYGTKTAPPRPFFRTMISKEQPGWSKMLKAALLSTNYDASLALGQLGLVMVGQLQQSIIDTYAPPLSPVTVMLRGMRRNDPSLVVSGRTVGEAARRVAEGKTNYGASTKPLVDTASMLKNVTSKVE